MRSVRHLLPLSLLALAACTGNEVQETLGIDRRAPDEFVVYSRPPLSVPPEFDLKPPRPGEEGPATASTEAQARATLLGTTAPPATLDEAAAGVDGSVTTAVEPVLTNDAPSGAQSSLLSKAGANAADPAIREKLAADRVAEPEQEKKAQSLYEQIVGDEKKEPVVDAPAEAERLRTNREEGKPVTEGDTPQQEEKPASVIDSLF